jgi:hypothetical protein
MHVTEENFVHEFRATLGRLRLRWENNIKMDITEIGLVLIGFTWLSLGTDRALLPIQKRAFGLPTMQGIS